jgi:hypothetical protein
MHDATSSKALEQRSHMQFVNRLPRIAAATLLAVVVPWLGALPSLGTEKNVRHGVD